MNGKRTMSESTEESNPDSPVTEPSGHLRFRLRKSVIAVIVICVLLAVFAPSVRHMRRLTLQVQCQNNLKQIALALHNYHDVHKAFPSATTYADDSTPLHSWRVAIVPYLEQQPFYDRYDYREPWNGPNNSLLGDDIPDTWYEKDGTPFVTVLCPPWYRCPGAPKSQNRWLTNYVMLIDDRPGKPNGPPNRPGSVPPSFDDKSAVIIIEIADSDIHWMEPRDVLLSELSMKINDRTKRSLSSYHGGACVVHADGTVEILDETTTEERVRELLAQ